LLGVQALRKDRPKLVTKTNNQNLVRYGEVQEIDDIDSPLVNASITPLFSRYFLNSCFFDSGVYKITKERRNNQLLVTFDFDYIDELTDLFFT
jgi:hypothetical protein